MLSAILCILSFIFAFLDTSKYWWLWLVASVIFLTYHIEKDD